VVFGDSHGLNLLGSKGPVEGNFSESTLSMQGGGKANEGEEERASIKFAEQWAKTPILGGGIKEQKRMCDYGKGGSSLDLRKRLKEELSR